MHFDINSVLGLQEKEGIDKLKKAGWKVRVRSRNGESYMGTDDFRMDRVNLVILDDKITKVSLG